MNTLINIFCSNQLSDQIALQFKGTDTFIHIYPNTDLLVNIKRDSALHIYKLVQKYNYTKGDSKKWSSFWRNLTQIERTMTHMFITNNSLNGFKGRFSFHNMSDLPIDFQTITPKSKLPKITSEIQEELEELFLILVKSLVSPEEVGAYWEEHYPNTCKLIKKPHMWQVLVENCFNPEQIKILLTQVLHNVGKDSFEKPFWITTSTNDAEKTDSSDNYTDEDFEFLIANEISLFSNSPYDVYSKLKNNF
jgi:hypothetical protein